MRATFPKTLGWLMAVVTGSFLFPVAAAADPAQRRPAPSDKSTAAAPAATGVEVRAIQLRLDELTAIQNALPPKPKPRIWEKLTRQASDRREAADLLLRRMASAQVVASRRTTVVVIADADDRDKVVASLGGVQRPVLVLYLDKEAQGEGFDNTWIRGSVLDKLRAALNMWVYVPKAEGVADDTPEQVSTHMATPLFWKTRFGLDGDVPDFTSEPKKSTAGTPAATTAGSPGRSATGPAPGPVAAPATGPAQDSVMAARIPNVKVLQEPATGARELATLAKGEEVVVAPGQTNGFVKVQTATTTGWVSATLLSSPGGDERRR